MFEFILIQQFQNILLQIQAFQNYQINYNNWHTANPISQIQRVNQYMQIINKALSECPRIVFYQIYQSAIILKLITSNPAMNELLAQNYQDIVLQRLYKSQHPPSIQIQVSNGSNTPTPQKQNIFNEDGQQYYNRDDHLQLISNDQVAELLHPMLQEEFSVDRYDQSCINHQTNTFSMITSKCINRKKVKQRNTIFQPQAKREEEPVQTQIISVQNEGANNLSKKYFKRNVHKKMISILNKLIPTELKKTIYQSQLGKLTFKKLRYDFIRKLISIRQQGGEILIQTLHKDFLVSLNHKFILQKIITPTIEEQYLLALVPIYQQSFYLFIEGKLQESVRVLYTSERKNNSQYQTRGVKKVLEYHEAYLRLNKQRKTASKLRSSIQ